jgi:hypothetical protein
MVFHPPLDNLEIAMDIPYDNLCPFLSSYFPLFLIVCMPPFSFQHSYAPFDLFHDMSPLSVWERWLCFILQLLLIHIAP